MPPAPPNSSPSSFERDQEKRADQIDSVPACGCGIIVAHHPQIQADLVDGSSADDDRFAVRERDGYPMQSGWAFDVTKGKRVRSQP